MCDVGHRAPRRRCAAEPCVVERDAVEDEIVGDPIGSAIPDRVVVRSDAGVGECRADRAADHPEMLRRALDEGIAVVAVRVHRPWRVGSELRWPVERERRLVPTGDPNVIERDVLASAVEIDSVEPEVDEPDVLGALQRQRTRRPGRSILSLPGTSRSPTSSRRSASSSSRKSRLSPRRPVRLARRRTPAQSSSTERSVCSARSWSRRAPCRGRPEPPLARVSSSQKQPARRPPPGSRRRQPMRGFVDGS